MQFQVGKTVRSWVSLPALCQGTAKLLGNNVAVPFNAGGVKFYANRGKIVNVGPKLYPGEGIKYTGFTYYPRRPDEVDPPYEPTQLFLIRQIRSVRGKPRWEKYIMERHLRLMKVDNITVVKNTPTVNAMLYKVKHLIQITPITFPYGMPDDPTKAFLDDHGRFIKYQVLNSVPLEEAEESVKQLKEGELGGQQLKDRLIRKYYERWQY